MTGLELLRQRISELETKNAKLETEKAEIEARHAELLKQVMEKDAKRDAENTELKSRVGELEARLAILEQGVTEVTGQPQNDKEVIAEVQVCLSKCPLSADEESGSIVDQQNNANTKRKENKKIDDCLLKRTPMPEVLLEITDVPDFSLEALASAGDNPTDLEKHNLGIEQENGNLSSRKNLFLREKVGLKKILGTILKILRPKQILTSLSVVELLE